MSGQVHFFTMTIDQAELLLRVLDDQIKQHEEIEVMNLSDHIQEQAINIIRDGR